MPDKPTQFPSDPTATMQAGAPAPAATKAKAGKKAKAKSAAPKVPRKPRTVDERIKSMIAAHDANLKSVKAMQKAELKELRQSLANEKQQAILTARFEAKTQRMTPAELEWWNKSLEAKLAATKPAPAIIPEGGEGKAA